MAEPTSAWPIRKRRPMGELAEQDALARALDRLHEAIRALPVRETNIQSITGDTNTAPLTDTRGRRFEAQRDFGVQALSGIGVESVGGGSLEISINDSEWIPVLAADDFPNMWIREFSWRVTTGATGTARLLVRWSERDVVGAG
jgi:hypothetical protein